jgi:hypothetical protein
MIFTAGLFVPFVAVCHLEEFFYIVSMFLENNYKYVF